MELEKIENQLIKILNDDSINTFEKTNQLSNVLEGIPEINDSWLKLIDAKLKGQYGSEYLTTEGDYKVLISFYRRLSENFPESARILLSLGDLLLLNRYYKESFAIFRRAFCKNPLLVFQAPGELEDFLQEYGNELQIIHHRLSIVKALLLDDSPEDAAEVYQELIEIYGSQKNFIATCLQDFQIQEDLLKLPTKLSEEVA